MINIYKFLGKTFKQLWHFIKTYKCGYNWIILFVIILIMGFQFRVMKRLLASPPQFYQMDLYFFKPKSYRIGLKVRLGTEHQAKWSTDELQIKLVKNTKEINEGITDIEQWKKVTMDINITIYTRQYMLQNPNIFNKQGNKNIQDIIRQQLARINQTICQTLRKQQQLGKHIHKNQHLKDWLHPENKLIDIFMVQKMRWKDLVYEEGQIRVSSLYGNINPTFWQTISVQSKKQQNVKQQISKDRQTFKQSTSYPKLLQKIYSKMID